MDTCNSIDPAHSPINLFFIGEPIIVSVRGVVALQFVRSTLKLAVRVRALAGDIILCSLARHFTLRGPLSAQVCKWVPANLMLGCNSMMD